MRIQSNPEVELTLSRTERVLALEGRNQAGARLVEDYDYQGKALEETAMDLMERAVEMGYLESGDTVSITRYFMHPVLLWQGPSVGDGPG